jgi:hypothetical protein
MTRNPFKGGDISKNSVGIGSLTRKMVLVSAEELAIINSDWLHQVSASDFERTRQQVTGEPDQMLHAARATARVDSRLV